MKTILITGCSSGYGLETALHFHRQGWSVIATMRTPREELLPLSDSLRIIPRDVTDPRSIGAALEASGPVDALVNNAGYGVPGRFLSSPWTTHADFLQVMVTAVAELTHHFLPAMEARGYGRVLSIASTAALVPASAGHTLYGASKAFVIAFSESLALESKPRGVHVTALCPGMTYSEFHDVNGMRSRVSRLPKAMWLDADTVARLGLDALERGDLRCVTGGMNRLVVGMAKYLPDPLARALIERRAKDFRNAD